MHQIAEPPRRPLGRYSYPTSHRVIELVSIAAWVVGASVLALRIAAAAADRASVAMAVGFALASAGAYLVADFASGLVHALCDNLGSADTPVVGQKFIRSFREHHVDPLDMTRGDFVRVNADNFLASLAVLVPTLVWVDVRRHLYAATFVFVLSCLVIVTNQIHKWAHIRHVGEQVPALVRVLQDRGAILSPAHHQVHHTPPHGANYCITSGVTNGFLNRIGFWPVLMRGCRFVGRHLAGSPAASS